MTLLSKYEDILSLMNEVKLHNTHEFMIYLQEVLEKNKKYYKELMDNERN